MQGKRQVVSFKTKKMRTVSPENWIVVENTHEPLVEKELWDRVQKRFNRHHHTVVRRTKNDMIGLFSGLIKCADCGMPLAYMRKQLKDRERVCTVVVSIITTAARLARHITLTKII